MGNLILLCCFLDYISIHGDSKLYRENFFYFEASHWDNTFTERDWEFIGVDVDFLKSI